MTASRPDFPEATPTPKPWDDDEISVREAVHRLGTHVIAIEHSLSSMRLGLQLELNGIKQALDDLKDRSEDTGRHIIQIATEAGEAKGLASRRTDSDPVRSIVVNVVTLAAKHWAVWLWRVLPIVTAGGMWAAHKLGWLGH